MITSIFNKSRPINFVIVFFIMMLAFSIANLKSFITSASLELFIEKTGLFFICSFSILLFHFIVSKNNLTKANHYQILIFGLLCLTFPQTTVSVNLLLSNFFILLGLRRILSLRSQISVKKKLFDTAFWFAMATLFYFWAILFFVLIFITLLLYTDNRVKNWIVPFASLATVFIISISASVVFYDDFLEIFNLSTEVSYNYTTYNTPYFLTATTLLLVFGGWSLAFYVKDIKKKKKAFRPSFKIILVVAIITFIMVSIIPQKTGSEFLFLFAPLSIIMTNYIESIKKKWVKELFLSTLIIVPFILLML